MPRSGQKKYLYLLKDKKVSLWYHTGKRSTKNVYLRRLGYLCETYNTNPRKLLNMSDRKRYEFVLKGRIQGRSGD